jgi:hypothetical protein
MGRVRVDLYSLIPRNDLNPICEHKLPLLMELVTGIFYLLWVLCLVNLQLQFSNCCSGLQKWYGMMCSATGGGSDAPYGRRTRGTFQSWESGRIHHA